jgi:hypothetical protein
VIGVIAAIAAVAVAVLLLVGDDDTETPTVATVPTTEVRGDDDDGTTSSAGTVPEGFEVVSNDDEGFSIALPADWEQFDLTEQTVDDLREALGEDNPQLDALLGQAEQLITQGGVLFALDPELVDGFSTNVNILKTPGESDVSSDALANALQDQYESIGATSLTSEVTELPTGAALRVDYVVPLNFPDGSTADVTGRQYYVSGSDSTWVLTFSTVDLAANELLFQQIADSFVVS